VHNVYHTAQTWEF